MAYSMVAVYGMDKEVGLVSYGQNNSSQQFYKPYSSFVHKSMCLRRGHPAKKKISRNFMLIQKGSHWIPLASNFVMTWLDVAELGRGFEQEITKVVGILYLVGRVFPLFLPVGNAVIHISAMPTLITWSDNHGIQLY